MTVDTPAWVRDAVFYQVFPDRLARSGRVPAPGDFEPWDAPPTQHGFKGGDLLGIVERLDYLQRLGVNALYLTPIFASASNHRYHTDDYLNVDPLLGGNEALRELLDEAHARGMRVLLDGVFNHCGRGFWPFHHVLENGIQSPYRGWFHLHDEVLDGARTLSAFPSLEQQAALLAMASEGVARGSISPAVLGYEAWWDLPALPRLALDEPQMRSFVLDVAEHWVRFGIDGWRLDVAEEVSADVWREFRTRVRAINPEAYLVAEIWHPRPDWLQGDLFDAFMNYPLGAAIVGFAAQAHLDLDQQLPGELRGVLRPLDGTSLWARLEELAALNHPDVTAVQLNLLDSHDTPRVLTLAGGDLDSLRLATLLQTTLPGAPCIYYGDEVGMAGAMDPHCRGAFPSDPAEWEREPYRWMADAIALRHSSRALRDGEMSLLHADGPALAYLRRHGHDAFAVVVNAGEGPLTWEVLLPVDAVDAELLPLGSDRQGDRRASLHGLVLRIRLAPRDGAVVRLTLGG